MTDPKTKLKAILSVFCDWVESWLEKGPDRELLQIAHARIGQVYVKIGQRLKAQ